MRKVLFVGDNTCVVNWGCRATSLALKSILSKQFEIIGFVTRLDISSYNPCRIKKANSRIGMLLLIIYRFLLGHVGIIQSISKKCDSDNIVSPNIDKSFRKFKKRVLKKGYYKDLYKKIKEADVVVLNGEGSFIFSTPARYDTLFYLLILKIAQDADKQTFCINAMFSDSPSSLRNDKIISSASEVLSRCTKVLARDPMSYRYFRANLLGDVDYVPDALFTWSQYSSYKDLCRNYPLSLIPFPEYDMYWEYYQLPQEYICLSGSSLAARFPEKAETAYLKLACEIKKRWNVVIVPTCSGDNFLYRVAEKLQLPILALKTNILGGMSVLQNASVFVSGRWHPSIMASLGGTPCVFMGSNSHKTIAIQEMLQYDSIHEYDAIPSDHDIDNIIIDINDILKRGTILRETIKKQTCHLSELTKGYVF